jgi:hypothetical protein
MFLWYTIMVHHSNIHIFIAIHSIYYERWGSHNALFIHRMDLCLEGLMMTQVESKHVALLT